MDYKKNNTGDDMAEERTESKTTILIVDDSEINRDVLKEIFKDDYTILEADNGKAAIDMVVKSRAFLAAILLDINMPEMDGFAVLTEIGKVKLLDKIPVIMITSDTSAETERKCYEQGVADVICKPFETLIVKQKVSRSIELLLSKKHLEEQITSQTKLLRAQYQQLQKQQEILKKNNALIVEKICTIVEFRNLESGYHLRRIHDFVSILGRYIMNMYPEYGLTQYQVDVMADASAMHDIGKITVPDTILLKPGRLTRDEFEVMKSHTTRGCDIIRMLSDIQDKDYFEYSYDICRHHHEKYDGNGYPDGLKGEDISIAAQLTGLADVYDALISERVYKAAYSMDKAFGMIVNGECGVFNPKLINCFRQAKLEMNNAFLKTKMKEKEELKALHGEDDDYDDD